LEKSSSKNPPPTNQSNSEQDRLKFRHNEDNASVISDITSHTHNLHSSTLATSSHRTQSNNGMSMTPNGALNDITYAYGNGQKVEGNVSLFLPPGKRFDHMGIKIQFLGQIYMVSVVYDILISIYFCKPRIFSHDSKSYFPMTSIYAAKFW